MSLTTLLLNRPIPRDAIELGHLVADPIQPDQDYCLPEFAEEGVEDGSSTNPAATLQRIENFQDVLEQTRGTKLELRLPKLLSIGASNPDSVSLKVSSSLCVIHQLRNSSAYFDAACEDRAVRDWLERQAKRPLRTAYLICGFKTLTDARVELVHYKDNVLDLSSSVPAAVIAGAASGLDAAARVSLNRESYENLGYTATGEQVFAVQYRKIRFALFSTKRVDTAYLDKSNRWKSYINTRSREGQQMDENATDGIEATPDESLRLEDLREGYDSIEVDGEEILYHAS
ncbi:hypothetical protein THARTR1_09431 [Trichoderma harzianum]|uniref:Uncharacterized protein n=1 Tax=Trichoderma harzianum TaxID=5544 RepID=A0A2K0TWN4_TRIHA|nr:hypothetical protein THARTR1_09431 [Trichoderma harzianum]